MSDTNRKMHLGVFAFAGGNHAAGWRHPDADIVTADFSDFARIIRTAERGLFDIFFLADSPGYALSMPTTKVSIPDPVVLLSGLAAITTHIGLAATASTTYSEPYIVARQFLSLDHLSGGRAAWNIVTTGSTTAGRNFGVETHPSHDDRYARAHEFVEVVKGLWASLDPDVLVLDREKGIFFDREKVHTLNHKGKFFSVQGPLNLKPSPQTAPVLIQAGASEPGKAFAGAVAEIVFSAQQDIEDARAFRSELRARAGTNGRNPENLLVLPGVMPVLAESDVEADRLFRDLQNSLDISQAYEQLANRFGQDLSAYDLDGPMPALSFDKMEGNRSRAVLLYEQARRENLTLREILAISAGSRGHKIVAGSPERIADTLIEWFDTGAADGFNIMPAFFNSQLELFVDTVIPILQRRGYFRTAYEHQTLRERFGLPLDPPLEAARAQRA